MAVQVDLKSVQANLNCAKTMVLSGSAPAQRGGLSACDWLVTWDPHLALKNPSLQEHAWASTATQKPHGGLRNSKIE